MNDDSISRQAAIDVLEKSRFLGAPYIDTGVQFALGEIKALTFAQPEQRWIPCTDVPDTDRNVFIARGEQGKMTVCIGHYKHDYKQWYEDRNWFTKCLYDGLYWCEIPPLPEPHKDEQ